MKRRELWSCGECGRRLKRTKRPKCFRCHRMMAPADSVRACCVSIALIDRDTGAATQAVRVQVEVRR